LKNHESYPPANGRVIGKEEEMDRNDEVIKQFGERVGYNEAESLL